MKRIFKRFGAIMACFCFIIGGAFALTACGEQFIEEREYQLVTMEIIKDKNFDRGYTDKLFWGDILLSKCTVDVGRKTTTLTFDDSELTNIVASFSFNVYTGSNVYPAYQYTTCSIKVYDKNVNEMTEEEIEALEDVVIPQQVGAISYSRTDIVRQLLQLKSDFENYESSLQIVTQNKSFTCHMVRYDEGNKNLISMSIIYGY